MLEHVLEDAETVTEILNEKEEECVSLKKYIYDNLVLGENNRKEVAAKPTTLGDHKRSKKLHKLMLN